MNPATKPTAADQPAAHLRVVADRVSAGTPGIHLSGVSKTYRARDGDVRLQGDVLAAENSRLGSRPSFHPYWA